MKKFLPLFIAVDIYVLCVYVYINSPTVLLQMLQLNLTQCVTNVALISLATFIIYNVITIII